MEFNSNTNIFDAVNIKMHINDTLLTACNADFSERILYYITNPNYLLYQLWLSIETFSWKL